jgi:hypothetical protein
MRLGIGLGLNLPLGDSLPGIGGVATDSLADLTLSAAGKIIIAGVMAVTLGNLTGTGAAQAQVGGTSGATLGDLTASATGTVKVQGSASVTLGDVAASGSGAHAVQGTASITLGAVTSSAAGSVKVQGAASPSLAALTASGTGAVIVQGTASRSLAAVTSSAAGTIKVQGAFSTTMGAATLSAAGTVGGGSFATITYVGGTSTSFIGSASGVEGVSLDDTLTGGSSGSPATGDLVIVVYATGSSVDRSIGVTTAGYTEVAELYSNVVGTDTNLSVSRALFGVDEGGTIDVELSVTGNANDSGMVEVHVWRGVDQTTPLDVTSTTATGTGTARPNPPSITPVTAGAMIIACGGGATASPGGAAFTQTGSELSNFISDAGQLSPNAAMAGVGSKAWTSGAFDPAAWVGGANNAGDSWAAVTLALRPGPA